MYYSKFKMDANCWAILILCSTVACAAHAEIQCMAGQSATSIDGDINLPFTVPQYYVNRLMLVGISWKPQSGDVISSITYAGNSLTSVGRSSNAEGLYIDIYFQMSPPEGTNSLFVDFLNNPHKGACVGIVAFAGVNQTTPLGTFVSSSGTGLNPFLNVPSAATDVIFDTLVTEKNAVISAGAGQTPIYIQTQNVNFIRGGASRKAASASLTRTEWHLSTAKNWGLAGVALKPVLCNDGVECTVDTVNQWGGCVHTSNSGLCNDGNPCNGSEICDPVLGCQSGTPLNCSDGITCTVDSCDPVAGCQHVPNNAMCDDGNACNGAETCNSITGCQNGTPPNCNDGIACTVDSCNPVAYSDDSALLFRRKAPPCSEGKRPMIPKDSALVFR